ncbi:hypothetical protein [Latilactobacillus sakei]|uniref:Uncharacterized protein n=1 Tax=Latilactobacillus sakei TaxID=1599 RepID=A0AAF0GTC6_LATSK|nr:hypothetical protein [Latilactobacillus sakei]WGI19241.1 hypothetical protein QBD03_00405 [Latilactobacillus sakei]
MKVTELLNVIPYITISKGPISAELVQKNLEDGVECYGDRPFSKVRSRFQRIFNILMVSDEFAKGLQKEWGTQLTKEEFAEKFNRKGDNKNNLENEALLLVLWFYLEYFEMVSNVPSEKQTEGSYIKLIDKLIDNDKVNKNKPWVYHKIDVIRISEGVEQTKSALEDLSASFLYDTKENRNLKDDKSEYTFDILFRAYDGNKETKDKFLRIILETLNPKYNTDEYEKEFKKLRKKVGEGDVAAYKQLNLLLK